jgi:hypothetical protein
MLDWRDGQDLDGDAGGVETTQHTIGVVEHVVEDGQPV